MHIVSPYATKSRNRVSSFVTFCSRRTRYSRDYSVLTIKAWRTFSNSLGWLGCWRANITIFTCLCSCLIKLQSHHVSCSSLAILPSSTSWWGFWLCHRPIKISRSVCTDIPFRTNMKRIIQIFTIAWISKRAC